MNDLVDGNKKSKAMTGTKIGELGEYDIKKIRQDILEFTQDSYTTRLFVFLFDQLDELDQEILNYTGKDPTGMFKVKYDYLSKVVSNWVKYSSTFRENVWDPNSPITKIIANYFVKKFIETVKESDVDDNDKSQILAGLHEKLKSSMEEVQQEIKEHIKSTSGANNSYD
jgi:hypothetical protein